MRLINIYNFMGFCFNPYHYQKYTMTRDDLPSQEYRLDNSRYSKEELLDIILEHWDKVTSYRKDVYLDLDNKDEKFIFLEAYAFVRTIEVSEKASAKTKKVEMYRDEIKRIQEKIDTELMTPIIKGDIETADKIVEKHIGVALY